MTANNSKPKRVRNRVRKSFGGWAFDIFNYTFIGLFAFACLYPYWNTFAVSLSSNRAILANEVILWPVELNLESYSMILRDQVFIRSMLNTIYMTLGGTLVNMVACILFAYPFSRPKFPGKNIFVYLLIFTMFFGGGLIPTFILMGNLGLMNSFFGLWMLNAYSIGNIIILRTFFQRLPVELDESAKIDGAHDMQALIKIVLPLSKAVLATLTLFAAVGWWNNFMGPLIYIQDPDRGTLMVRLRQLLDMGTMQFQQIMDEGIVAEARLLPEQFRAAAIFVSTVPIICVYPFLQKHFAKGVLIGGIKG